MKRVTMKKEYSPELYNYNKYPGPSFVRVDDLLKSEEITLSILEHTGSDFNVEAFNQRFSEFLLKYDYIVGDWGNEQLRLKGFYKDSNNKPNHFKISRLQDYLKEYCNFGCDYFVLSNPEPREMAVEEEFRPVKRRRRRSPKKPQTVMTNRDDKRQTDGNFKKKKKSRPTNRTKKPKQSGESGSRGHFTIRQKG